MADKQRINQIIHSLNLEPHPEGGYYRETYRSSEHVNREDGSSRNAGTAIYFLLTADVCTKWHRFGSDELWHFYKGDQLVIEVINEDGAFEQLLLNDPFAGEGQLQQLIPKNSWQRAYSSGAFTLVGTTVFPGFEFEDFEMIDQDELAIRFPEFRSEITNNPFK